MVDFFQQQQDRVVVNTFYKFLHILISHILRREMSLRLIWVAVYLAKLSI